MKKKCSVNTLNIISHQKRIKSNSKGFILITKNQLDTKRVK